jgi:carboxymethylenebutenolidase
VAAADRANEGGGRRSLPGDLPFPDTRACRHCASLQGRLPALCQARLYGGGAALYARQPDVTKIADIKDIMPIVLTVPDVEVLSDLDATVVWMAANKGDTKRLGVTGFCWGGRIVWLYAAHNPALKAAVAWYGPLNRPTNELQVVNPPSLVKDLKAPVLGLYGGADQGIPLADIEGMRDAVKSAPKPCEIVIYPDTPHGFNADYRPSYRPEQAKDGWKRLQEWFKKNGAA